MNTTVWMAALAVCTCVEVLDTPVTYTDTAELPSAASQLIPGIPNLHLFLFAGGLIACIVGLVVMRLVANRNDHYYDDED